MTELPQLIDFVVASRELETTTDKLKEIGALGLAPFYRLGWGHERIKRRDLPKWRAAIEHYDSLWGKRRVYKSTSEDGYVYYVQCADGKGPIKVGTARNVAKRFSDLQGSSPYLLKLLAVEPGGEKRERERHFEFRMWRLHGEWFRSDCTELKCAIKQARKEWGQPRKNCVPKKLLAKSVESGLTELEVAV